MTAMWGLLALLPAAALALLVLLGLRRLPQGVALLDAAGRCRWRNRVMAAAPPGAGLASLLAPWAGPDLAEALAAQHRAPRFAPPPGGLPAIFLPMAVHFGFTDQKLVALLVMLGSVTTPAGYVMAKQMGHEGTLTGSVCVTTTFFSALTLTFWVFWARSNGFIA